MCCCYLKSIVHYLGSCVFECIFGKPVRVSTCVLKAVNHKVGVLYFNEMSNTNIVYLCIQFSIYYYTSISRNHAIKRKRTLHK